MRKTEICAILALGPSNVIGIKDKMAWHSTQDGAYYKKTTLHYPCIFGKNTFFGLPSYPQSDRLNIVVSREYIEEKVITTEKGSYIEVSSIEKAISLCKHYSKVFICGGASVYKYAFENNIIDTVYLTRIDSNSLINKIDKHPNDYVKFPFDLIKYLKNWKCTNIFPTDLPEEETDIKALFTIHTK